MSPDKRVVAADRWAAGLQRKPDKLGVTKVLIFYLEPPDAYIIYPHRL